MVGWISFIAGSIFDFYVGWKSFYKKCACKGKFMLVIEAALIVLCLWVAIRAVL